MYLRLVPIACLSLLSACAGNAVKDSDSIQQSAMQQAKAIEQTPESVIAQSQSLQLEAQKADLYFYSPSYMEQAEGALEDAEDAIKSKKLAHEIIAYALTAKKLFNRGLENKTTVLKQLSASFDGLAMLKAIDTHKVLASDFQELRDDTKDLIILIEQGKTTEAINEQKDLLNDISDVEIQTLKKTFLTVAENALDKAEDADADDFAAKSFSDAQKNIETFEKFIETSAKEREQIKEKSLLAIRLAQHAEHVAKAAVPLLKLNKETAEEHILYVETLINRIAVALGQENISHLNLNSQSMAIAQTAETVNKLASLHTQPLQSEAALAAEKVAVSAIIEESQKEIKTANTENSAKKDVALNTDTQQPITTAKPDVSEEIADVAATNADLENATEAALSETENATQVAETTEETNPQENVTAEIAEVKTEEPVNNADELAAPAETPLAAVQTEEAITQAETAESKTAEVETKESEEVVETVAVEVEPENETQDADVANTEAPVSNNVVTDNNAVAIEQAP